MSYIKITSDDKVLCASCGLASDGVLIDAQERDDVAECSLCGRFYEYERESAVYCGDCLVPLEQCAHATNYKRGREG